MKDLLTLLALLILPAAAFSSSASQAYPAPCAIQGVVLDLHELPIPGAAITVNPGKSILKADSEGRFCIPHDSQAQSIMVAVTGFEPQSFRLDEAAESGRELRIILRPSFKQQDVIVYATGEEQKLMKTPVRIDILGRQIIDRSLSNTIADALEFLPGVRVDLSCQTCNFAQVRLLGLAGAYTQILVDGLPLISSLAQVYGIEQIPTSMTERIEVIKGGGSVVHGAGAVAGAINIISRRPVRSGGAFETRFENMYGEPNHSHNVLGDFVSKDRKTTVTAFGQFDRIKPLDFDGDGFTEVGRRGLEAFGARLHRIMLEDRGEFIFDFSHTRENRRGGNNLHLPEHMADIAESTRSRRSTVSAGWKHYIRPDLDYRLTGSFAYMRRDSYYGSGMDPNAYGETSNPLLVLDSQLNHYQGNHVLSLGLQHSSDYLEDLQPAYDLITDDVYRNTGVYAQHSWSFARGWEILYGGRVDKHSAVRNARFSPRAGLKWTTRHDLNFRGSVALGFRAPQVFNEDLHVTQVGGEGLVIRNDAGLQPESATTYMLGTEWRPSFGIHSGLVEINAFSTNLRDLFNVIDTDDPLTSDREFTRVNFGTGRIHGVEVNLGYALGNRFRIEGGFVFQKGRYNQPEPDFGSFDFFRTPTGMGTMSFFWNAGRIGELFFGMRRTGAMLIPHYAGYIPEDRLEKSKAYTVIDANITRRLPVLNDYGLSLTVGVKNLTNTYQDDLGRGPLRDSGYVWGPRFPRTFIIGLKARF
ncbi:MAG TPA: TonB-dependent receptor [Acidobacteriota bacterium]|nr:TonB-dependent receptor [Acidobacteriota bacterium]